MGARWRYAIVASILMALLLLAVVLNDREETFMANAIQLTTTGSAATTSGAARRLLDSQPLVREGLDELNPSQAHTVLSSLIAERRALEKLLKKQTHRDKQRQLQEEANRKRTNQAFKIAAQEMQKAAEQKEKQLLSQEHFLISERAGFVNNRVHNGEGTGEGDDNPSSLSQHNVELDEDELDLELANNQMHSRKEQQTREKAANKMLVDKFFRQYKRHASRQTFAAGKAYPNVVVEASAQKTTSPSIAVAGANVQHVTMHATKAEHSTSSPRSTEASSLTGVPDHAINLHSRDFSVEHTKQTSTMSHKNGLFVDAEGARLNPGHARQAKIPKHSDQSTKEAKRAAAAAHDSPAKVRKARHHAGHKPVPPTVMEEDNKISVVPERQAIDDAAKVVVERSSKPVMAPMPQPPEEPPVTEAPNLHVYRKWQSKNKKKVAVPQPEVEETADNEITSYIIWGSLGLLVLGMLTTVMCLACQPDRSRPWGMPPKRNY